MVEWSIMVSGKPKLPILTLVRRLVKSQNYEECWLIEGTKMSHIDPSKEKLYRKLVQWCMKMRKAKKQITRAVSRVGPIEN